MKLKIGLTEIANVATIVACVVISVAVWRGRSVAVRSVPVGPTAPAIPVEKIDGKTKLPSSTTTGKDGARVVVIEFSDFECPFCGQYARDTFPRIRNEYIDTGKIAYAYRHFPLPIHPNARDAAQAASCAADQRQFWPMHDELFSHQRALTEPDLTEHAVHLALDEARFLNCLHMRNTGIDDDMAEGKRLGVVATPSFVVGIIHQGGVVELWKRIRGAQPIDTFRAVLAEALATRTS